MQANHPDYRAMRREVEVRLKQKKRSTRWAFFFINLLMFIAFVFLVLQLGQNMESINGDVVGAMVMLGVGWFTSVLFHLVSAILDLKTTEDSWRGQLMVQVMDKAMVDIEADDSEAPAEKAKRMMRLTDDGELEEIVLETDLPRANSASDYSKSG